MLKTNLHIISPYIKINPMINLIEMILMGALATLFMDLAARPLAKMKVIHPLITPQMVGRWTLYTLRGKLVHDDINKTPQLKNEKLAALISHYLIGIALAGMYLYLELTFVSLQGNLVTVLVFGIATVVFPWFWLYPSIGIGFLASKAPRRYPYIITSLINHTNFGLGFVIWILVFRPLF